MQAEHNYRVYTKTEKTLIQKTEHKTNRQTYNNIKLNTLLNAF